MPKFTVNPAFLQGFQSTSYPKPSFEAFRLRVRYFSNALQSSTPITIPDNWMPFFIFLLLQNPTFSLAKDFLQSPAWSFFSNNPQGNSSLFYLPSSCPPVNLQTCPLFTSTSNAILEDLDDLDNQAIGHQAFGPQPASPKTDGTLMKKQKFVEPKKPVLSEAGLRSNRLKKIHKGFKSVACKDKNCVGCSATPPSISTSVIRNLGASFCNINPDELTEESLNRPAQSKAAKKTVKRKSSGPSSSRGSDPK